MHASDWPGIWPSLTVPIDNNETENKNRAVLGPGPSGACDGRCIACCRWRREVLSSVRSTVCTVPYALFVELKEYALHAFHRTNAHEVLVCYGMLRIGGIISAGSCSILSVSLF